MPILVPQCPHADILGPKGRAWLLRQLLPDDESAAIERHIREYDRTLCIFGSNLKIYASPPLLRKGERQRISRPSVGIGAAVGDFTKPYPRYFQSCR